MMVSLLRFSSIPLTTILIEYHTQGTLKVLMIPWSRCSITDIMFGGKKKKKKKPLWNIQCGTLGVLGGQGTLFKITWTLKVSALLARNFLMSRTKHWWNQSSKRELIVQAFLYNQKTDKIEYFSSRLRG